MNTSIHMPLTVSQALQALNQQTNQPTLARLPAPGLRGVAHRITAPLKMFTPLKANPCEKT